MKGSVRTRGATYTAIWSTTDPATGKRLQHSRGGFTTKRAAQAHLNDVLGKPEHRRAPEKPLTVAELLQEHWLPAQRSRELRPATLAQYGYAISAWIVPRIGATKVGDLTPATVVRLVDSIRHDRSSTGRKGLSPRSAQLAVGVLKSATSWALQNGLLRDRDPLAGVRRPRSVSAVMKTWTAEEARHFLDLTRDDRLAPAWALFLARGLRRGEVCGLRWPNVDLAAGRLVVAETRVVVDGQAVTSTPKTDAGRRKIALDPFLVAVLKSHRARQAQEKLSAGGDYEDEGYVVADEFGRPYHPDTLAERFDVEAKAAGLPRIRLHDTRHTAATLMLADGTPTKVVTEVLGHSSPTITLSIYAHVLPGMAEEAGASLSASLLG